MGYINGFLHKDKKKIYLVSFLTEKKYEIKHLNLDHIHHLTPDSIVLVEYTGDADSVATIKPVIASVLFYNTDDKKQISTITNTLTLDALISVGYKVAIKYKATNKLLQEQKEEDPSTI